MFSFPKDEQPRRVAIYSRVSTAEQRLEGFSLDAQKQKLIAHVTDNVGLNLITKPEWFFTDTHTGSDINRPGLDAMMDLVRAKKCDVILVLKIDRLSRSLKHLLMIFEELEKHEVSLMSLQENLDFRGPMGRLVFQIFGSIAQFERELIKGRTVMGKLASAGLGNYTGTHIPYGYKAVLNSNGKGKKIELDPAEREWVTKIYDWYIYEGLGDGQIAERLNERRVPKGKAALPRFRDTEWSEKYVKTILTNPIYRGSFIASQRDELGSLLPEEKWTVVPVPSCVSEIAFLQAQHARKQHIHPATGDIYLLSGKLVDMGLPRLHKFTGIRRQKGGVSYRRKQTTIDGVYYPVFEIPGRQIEEWVWNQLVLAFKDPDIFIHRFLAKKDERDRESTKLENELAQLRSNRMEADLALARINQAYEHGIYSEERMKERVQLQEEAITAIDKRVLEIEQELFRIGQADLEIQKLKEASEEMKGHIDNYNRAQQKAVCQICVARVEMYRERLNGKWQVSSKIVLRFNPEQLTESSIKVRTGKSLTEEERKKLSRGNNDVGGDGRNRTAV
jgi:site-specific DNA recombinase